jgi:hypothetical protein
MTDQNIRNLAASINGHNETFGRLHAQGECGDESFTPEQIATIAHFVATQNQSYQPMDFLGLLHDPEMPTPAERETMDAVQSITRLTRDRI